LEIIHLIQEKESFFFSFNLKLETKEKMETQNPKEEEKLSDVPDFFEKKVTEPILESPLEIPSVFKNDDMKLPDIPMQSIGPVDDRASSQEIASSLSTELESPKVENVSAFTEQLVAEPVIEQKSVSSIVEPVPVVEPKVEPVIEPKKEKAKIPIPQSPKLEVKKEELRREVDFGSMSDVDVQKQIELLKAQYLILFNKSKINEVPDINPQNVASLHRQYNRLIKNMKSKRNSNLFRILLIISWIILEVVCCYLGLKAQGYTAFQLKLMDSYDDILMELGEEYELFGGFGWRPEVKLVFISLGSLLVFVVTNYIVNFIGEKNASLLQNSFVLLFSGKEDIVGKINDFIDEKVMPIANKSTESAPSSVSDLIGNFDVAGLIGGVGKVLSGLNKQNPTQDNVPRKRRPVYTS
jgi:hypothetical protein